MSVTALSTEDSRASLVAALNQGAGTTGAAAEMSDRFLKLLVAQLKNQDPMNPMENAEMTSQLAQMSTVEGVNNLNASLNELSRATQVLQGASLVGHSVLAEGDTLALTASGGLGGVELASAADSVKVTVLNEQGAVLRVLDLGGQEAGLVRFAWDGKDAAGVLQANGGYSFKVAATAAGSNVSNTTYGVGSVLSVALNTDGIEAEVSGMGVLGLDKIRQVY